MVRDVYGRERAAKVLAYMGAAMALAPAVGPVLGGLMLDNTAWDRIADQVSEQDFYRREHQLIFAAVASLADMDRPFDVVTLAEELERLESLDEVGGLPYLGMLANDTPSAANIAAYAAIVREQSVIRQLIKVGNQIA